jgi:hypothetical protein
MPLPSSRAPSTSSGAKRPRRACRFTGAEWRTSREPTPSPACGLRYAHISIAVVAHCFNSQLYWRATPSPACGRRWRVAPDEGGAAMCVLRQSAQRRSLPSSPLRGPLGETSFPLTPASGRRGPSPQFQGIDLLVQPVVPTSILRGLFAGGGGGWGHPTAILAFYFDINVLINQKIDAMLGPCSLTVRGQDRARLREPCVFRVACLTAPAPSAEINPFRPQSVEI